MRVLLVNAFHYLKGGVERTYLDESRWLTEAGHEVAHLATKDPRNLPSPTADSFAPAVDFTEGGALGAQLRHLPNALWSRPAERAMETTLAAFKPDVAHLHAPSRYLTPSILRPLERAGVPTVMTLHDFKPWCTNRILYAHGAPCERCRGGGHWHAAATGCVQGSRAKSVVGTVEAYLHEALGAYRHVKLWIAPSRFVEEKARAWGLPDARVRLLPHGLERTPVSDGGDAVAPVADRPFALFSGRLSEEKGVALLPGIAAALGDTPLLVAGDGPLRASLEDAARRTPSLHVFGHLSDEQLARLRARAAVVLVPSRFYEHFCYAAAEALLESRPVVAARIGAIPELVEHEVTGLLAEPGDAAGFAAGARRALADAAAPRWATAGSERVRRVANPAAHVNGLLAIYKEAIVAR
ncbi:MAG TPA: glycosyltransferase [Candidatus Saccharimonadaceae bacterium]|nr:glycosyltransferase [Candidatus Saccharimonadaceae bacterium]